MSDDWQFFPCTMGESSAFIFLDLGVAEKLSEAPSTLVRIHLEYKSPREDGLPTQEEYDPVKAVEDQISADAKENGDWYVGRVTTQGERTFYLYTLREITDWEKFAEAVGRMTGYRIRLSHFDDPEHRIYRENLFPTEDDWQVIKDIRVLEQLEKAGDSGHVPRKVDHWIYFSERALATDFVIWAEGDRFTDQPDFAYTTDDGRFCVRLCHEGSMGLNDITSHTLALRRKAVEYGGDYDGWETPVIKGDG